MNDIVSVGKRLNDKVLLYGLSLPKFLLLLFILFDLFFTFRQQINRSLDGDLPVNVIISPPLQKTFDDPIGIKTIWNNDKHPNPNRYFAQAALHYYYAYVPNGLQYFFSPIESVYVASALVKTFFHLCILLVLTAWITGFFALWNLRFLGVASLLTALIQTNGYFMSVGLVDPAPSYAFNYAFPLIPLLIYLTPVIWERVHGQTIQLSVFQVVLFWMLAFMVAFSGPLNPGAAVLFCGLMLLRYLPPFAPLQSPRKIWKSISRTEKLLLLPIVLLCLYSVYLGTYNTHNGMYDHLATIGERYALLPAGLWEIFTHSDAWPLLLIGCAVNTILMRRSKDSKNHVILQYLYWILGFSLLYLLLLPLGGFRDYRPLIIRYDTFIPITTAFLFYFGISSYRLVIWYRNNPDESKVSRLVFGSILIGLFLLFATADLNVINNRSKEMEGLQLLSKSQEEVTLIPFEDPVVGWGPKEKPEHSHVVAKLLHLWNITDEERLFYQIKSSDPTTDSSTTE